MQPIAGLRKIGDLVTARYSVIDANTVPFSNRSYLVAHDVFLSYSSKDKLAADAACDALERHGIRVWMAPRDIVPGIGWATSIVSAINGAQIMLLVFSRNANTSPQIEREVERAINKGIPVLPLRLEDVKPSDALEYFISAPQWLDAFTPPFEQHLARLADAVKQLIGSNDTRSRQSPPSAPNDHRGQDTIRTLHLAERHDLASQVEPDRISDFDKLTEENTGAVVTLSRTAAEEEDPKSLPNVDPAPRQSQASPGDPGNFSESLAVDETEIMDATASSSREAGSEPIASSAEPPVLRSTQPPTAPESVRLHPAKRLSKRGHDTGPSWRFLIYPAVGAACVIVTITGAVQLWKPPQTVIAPEPAAVSAARPVKVEESAVEFIRIKACQASWNYHVEKAINAGRDVGALKMQDAMSEKDFVFLDFVGTKYSFAVNHTDSYGDYDKIDICGWYFIPDGGRVDGNAVDGTKAGGDTWRLVHRFSQAQAQAIASTMSAFATAGDSILTLVSEASLSASQSTPASTHFDVTAVFDAVATYRRTVNAALDMTDPSKDNLPAELFERYRQAVVTAMNTSTTPTDSFLDAYDSLPTVAGPVLFSPGELKQSGDVKTSPNNQTLDAQKQLVARDMAAFDYFLSRAGLYAPQ